MPTKKIENERRAALRPQWNVPGSKAGIVSWIKQVVRKFASRLRTCVLSYNEHAEVLCTLLRGGQGIVDFH